MSAPTVAAPSRGRRPPPRVPQQVRRASTTSGLAARRMRAVRRTAAVRADPADVPAEAVGLARHDALRAEYQAHYASATAARLLGQIRGVLAVGCTLLAVPALRSSTAPPAAGRWAIVAFFTVGLAVYLYTAWTSRPRVPRAPDRNSSGWVRTLNPTGDPTATPTDHDLATLYLDCAGHAVAGYAREARDHARIAYDRHRRNGRSHHGLTVLVLLGLLCAALVLL